MPVVLTTMSVKASQNRVEVEAGTMLAGAPFSICVGADATFFDTDVFRIRETFTLQQP